MPSTRRKSVAFAELEAPPATRTRRSTGKAAATEPAPSELPATAATRPSKKRLEADGGFKFKRQRAAPPAAQNATRDKSAAPVAAELAVPACRPQKGSEAAVEASVRVAEVLPSVAVAGEAVAPPAAAPTVEALVAPSAPNLDGLPLDVLHALLEECVERQRSESLHCEAPRKMELAIEACMHELRRQGVTQVAAIVSETDAAASRTAGKGHAPVVSFANEQPDAQLLDSLPALPDIASGLQQLQTLAVLCDDQVSSAMRRADLVVQQCAKEQQRLAQQFHSAAFKGFLDVEQPQSLLHSLAAA